MARPDLRRERLRWSVEVGHVYWSPALDIERHLRQIAALAHPYRVARRAGVPLSLCVLVDDQDAPDQAAVADYLERLDAALGLDWVCFETRMAPLFPQLLDLLDDPEPVALDVTMRYGGQPQCTHYIAIWHLLRLGLIAGAEVMEPWSRAARAGRRGFVADRAVSILSERYRVVEEQAQRRLLRKSLAAQEARRIVRRYYPESHPAEPLPLSHAPRGAARTNPLP